MFKNAEATPTVDSYNFMQLSGANTDDEEIYSEHPDYTERKEGFQVAYDSYNGVGQFLNGAALDKFSIRESKDRFKDRKSQTYYINIVKGLINFPVNAIFSGEFTRPDFPELYANATDTYGGWDSFWKLASYEAKLFSVAFIMVDRNTNERVDSENDRLKNPARLSLIPVMNVVDWKISGNVFQWVKVIEEAPVSRLNWRAPGAFVPRLRIWTPESFHVYDLDENGKWKFAFEGANTFGVVPIIPFYGGRPDTNSVYGDTSGLQLGFLSRRLYNQTNESDNQLRGTAFNILAVPSQDGEPQDLEIGSTSVLFYDPVNGGEPRFVAPSSEPVKICMERETQLIKAMHNTVDADDTLTKLPTATQVSYISEAAARSIRELAFYGQQAEKWTTELLLEVEHGQTVNLDDEVIWPMDYSQQVLTDNFVAKVIQLLSINWPSERANKEFAKFFSTHLIPLKESERDQILAEIEASDGMTSFDLSNQTELSGVSSE